MKTINYTQWLIRAQLSPGQTSQHRLDLTRHLYRYVTLLSDNKPTIPELCSLFDTMMPTSTPDQKSNNGTLTSGPVSSPNRFLDDALATNSLIFSAVRIVFFFWNRVESNSRAII